MFHGLVSKFLVPSIIIGTNIDPIKVNNHLNYQMSNEETPICMDSSTKNIHYGKTYDNLIHSNFLENLNENTALAIDLVDDNDQYFLNEFKKNNIDLETLFKKINADFDIEKYKNIFVLARNNNIDLIAIKPSYHSNSLLKNINGESLLKINDKFIIDDDFNKYLKNNNKFSRTKNINTIYQNYVEKIINQALISSIIDNYMIDNPCNNVIVLTDSPYFNNQDITKMMNKLYPKTYNFQL